MPKNSPPGPGSPPRRRSKAEPKPSPIAPPTSDREIRLRGIRQNNLKNFDLNLPLGKLIVMTGLSGSGKSSLAFETLYAEGQRRYIETFTPYARQFFDRMDKPAVDRIDNIPPAIAIEQRNAVRTTRSTVGTMTEICEHMKNVWPHLSVLHCKNCGERVRRESPQQIWDSVQGRWSAENAPEILVTFELALSPKLSQEEQFGLLGQQGFQRILLENRVVRLDEAGPVAGESRSHVTVVADRVRWNSSHRSRVVEALEQAYKFGNGRLALRELTQGESGWIQRFSLGYHCAPCDLEYREPTSALFSFNNPIGACATCKGFGRVVSIDPFLAVPDRTKTLGQGAVRPWQTGMSAECQSDMVRMAKRQGIPLNVPFHRLSAEHQSWVMDGEPGYGTDGQEWPHAWYGVKGYFKWLESNAYKMHVRVLLSRYRSYRQCPDCRGKRFNPDSLLYRLPPASTGSDLLSKPLSLADFYQLPIRDAYSVVETLHSQHPGRRDPLAVVLGEVRARLGYLNEVGLSYLTLDRATRTLSGGETERVSLTTSLGTRLVNTLFVLDEPSVGLHPRDTGRLIRILHRLRDSGNTVVVVEHEASVILAADQIVDLGPGHGESGGNLVFQGPPSALPQAVGSLTADYLSGRRRLDSPPRRRTDFGDGTLTVPSRWLRLAHANVHNLQDVAVALPLGRMVAITGVSGSGKTTLLRDVLLPLLKSHLSGESASEAGEGEEDAPEENEAAESVDVRGATLSGWDAIGAVVLVDQTSLGRTPRSNPAVYVGAFEEIRELYAASEVAKSKGMDSSSFSFNSKAGQCERCRGAGFEKIEMQFLSDIYVRCPVCGGRRYRPHVLEVKIEGAGRAGAGVSWSIADFLEATIDEAVTFLSAHGASAPARKAATKLRLLVEVGLGYLRVGQPINTLSGGESQRLKLVSHLTGPEGKAFPRMLNSPEAVAKAVRSIQNKANPGGEPDSTQANLFLFDEPTTGLHFDDVRVLLAVFQRLVDAGHTVVVIEHNLEVIHSADWVIDLGPDAGDAGGRVVVAGPPETVAACLESHTGRFLREHRVR